MCFTGLRENGSLAHVDLKNLRREVKGCGQVNLTDDNWVVSERVPN